MKTSTKVLLGLGAAYLLTRDDKAPPAGVARSSQPAGGPEPTRMYLADRLPVGEAGSAADNAMTQGQGVAAQLDERARQTLEQTQTGQAAIDAERRFEDAVRESFVTADGTTAGGISMLTFGF